MRATKTRVGRKHLSDKQRARILALWRSGLSYAVIAKRYDCSRTTIGRAVNEALLDERAPWK